MHSASRLRIISCITSTTLARSPAEGCGSERAASVAMGCGEGVRSWDIVLERSP